MLHNKGMKFWGRVIDKLDSKELTEKDYSYMDSLENKITGPEQGPYFFSIAKWTWPIMSKERR